MNSSKLAWEWIKATDAKAKFGNLEQAKSVAGQLISGYNQFLKTGRWAKVDRSLYDFHDFLHCFADYVAGKDDDLYRWLVKQGEIMLQLRQSDKSKAPAYWCSICGSRVGLDRAARRPDGSIRWTAQGKVWCEKCMESFGKRIDL